MLPTWQIFGDVPEELHKELGIFWNFCAGGTVLSIHTGVENHPSNIPNGTGHAEQSGSFAVNLANSSGVFLRVFTGSWEPSGIFVQVEQSPLSTQRWKTIPPGAGNIPNGTGDEVKKGKFLLLTWLLFRDVLEGIHRVEKPLELLCKWNNPLYP